MKKRFGWIIIGGILLVFLGCVSVLAISKRSVNYHFFSKKAAVRIENYTKKNGTYIPLEAAEITVLPGEFISRIPIIYNEGIDCYVRVQVMITSEKQPSVPITLENIVGLSDKWISIGDYLYYKDVLLEDSVIEVFEGICIPTEWVDAVDSGNRWEVQVKVDAIQAEHVVPDFRGKDPWGEQKETFEIWEAKEDEELKGEEMKSNFSFTIESEVEAFRIEVGETFQNMGGFVPGDVKEHEIMICNLDEHERILYMKARVPQVNTLLSKMQVTVSWECEMLETVLYQGEVSNVADALDKIHLVIPGNAEGILRVSFLLPKNVDNSCTAQEGNVCLTFLDETFPVGNKNIQEDTERFGKKQESEGKDAIEDSFVVQTGDDSKIWNAIIGLSIGVCLFFLYLWKGKRDSHGW